MTNFDKLNNKYNTSTYK